MGEWEYGGMWIWVYGDMGVRVYGDMGVLGYGCMGVHVHECMQKYGNCTLVSKTLLSSRFLSWTIASQHWASGPETKNTLQCMKVTALGVLCCFAFLSV